MASGSWWNVLVAPPAHSTTALRLPLPSLQAVIGGREYHTFASGPLYILSNSAGKLLSAIEPASLRHLANEGAMHGSFLPWTYDCLLSTLTILRAHYISLF